MENTPYIPDVAMTSYPQPDYMAHYTAEQQERGLERLLRAIEAVDDEPRNDLPPQLSAEDIPGHWPLPWEADPFE